MRIVTLGREQRGHRDEVGFVGVGACSNDGLRSGGMMPVAMQAREVRRVEAGGQRASGVGARADRPCG
jgi:hypothetical protein